jgi:hypothetical protein
LLSQLIRQSLSSGFVNHIVPLYREDGDLVLDEGKDGGIREDRPSPKLELCESIFGIGIHGLEKMRLDLEVI